MLPLEWSPYLLALSLAVTALVEHFFPMNVS